MTRTRVKKILGYLLYPMIILAALFAVWAIVAAVVDNYFLFPTIGATFQALGASLTDGAFWAAVGGTIGRTLLAFIIAAICALTLAVCSVFFRPVRKILTPLVAIMRALPTLAVVLILAVWMSPQAVPLVVVLLVTFPVLYSGLLGAFDHVDRGLIEMSKVYGVSKKHMATKLVIPNVLPGVLPLIGSTLSLSVKLMVAAEIMSDTAHSIGALMKGANIFFNMGQMFALTLVAVLIAVSAEGVFYLLTKRLTRWAK